jgi:hydrogenase-4 component B
VTPLPPAWADPTALLLCAALLTFLSGLPGQFLRGRSAARAEGGPSPLGQRIAAALSLAASAAGLPAALSLLLAPRPSTWTLSWTLPFGACDFAADSLSAFFLLPVFLVSACASVYALRYWPASENGRTEPALTFFQGTLCGSMALLLLARNGVAFLMAWEAMALSAYFALAAEHRKEEVRRASTVYLVATHIGTMALFVLFALLRSETGSFAFPALRSLGTSPSAGLLFLLALAGFGAKAGLMPLHVWLPSAHANAPSHVSALLSGVMLKMGVYGLLRFVLFHASPPLWWGALLLALGSLSAVLGIVFAAGQGDVKRLLAYSSIENLGIVAAMAGLSLVGSASGNRTVELLGMAGALVHALNHSLFKPLLFLGSGALIHGAGSREMNRMGGMARRMPVTAALFLMGCAAICALPPFNGFAGEFIVYSGLLEEARSAAFPWLALFAPVLALAGGVAALAFVKLYGTVFLGNPRSGEAASCHEAPAAMTAPMALLAALCLLFGLLPALPVRLAEAVTAEAFPAAAAGAGAVSALVPLGWITAAGLLLAALASATGLLLLRRLRRLPPEHGPTWGCGYLAPTARMQYTGGSFSEMLSGLFAGAARPRREEPAVTGIAPGEASFGLVPTETLLDRAVRPAFRLAETGFAFLHKLQHGRIHVYMLYIFVTLFLLMFLAR